MRSLLVLVAALLVAPPASAETAAFVNVNVVPMTTATVIEQQTVIVSNGLIETVGPVDETPIPKGAIVIDGTDRFLMPGLAEMHAHVPAADANSLDRDFSLYVANGITTIRGMLGQASHLDLRVRLESGNVFGPRLITSGPSLNGRSVAGAEHAQQMVRDQHHSGYDLVKIHPGLTAAEFDAIAATANELGIPFAGHVPVAAGVSRALQLDMATIDHLDGYFAALLPADSIGAGGYGGFFDVMLAAELDPERIREIALETAAAGTWNVPTEILVEVRVNKESVAELRNLPGMQYIPKDTVDRWAASKEALLAERGFNPGTAERAIKLRRQLILELHRASAGLLLGSDAPQVFNVPGYSVHRELAALVASGLTPYEALRTGTVAVAEYLGSNSGEVTAGRAADLVLVDANPLEDIQYAHRIHGVMLRGTWYSADALFERLKPYENNED